MLLGGLAVILGLARLPTPLHQLRLALEEGPLVGLSFVAPLLGVLVFVVGAFTHVGPPRLPPFRRLARRM